MNAIEDCAAPPRCVEDEVEAFDVGRHFVVVARHHHVIGAQRSGRITLGFGGGKGHHLGPHGVGQLDPHMPQAADADHADFLPGPTCQWRSGEYVVIPAHSSGAGRRLQLRFGDEVIRST